MYIKLTALIVTVTAFAVAYDLTKVFWTIIPKDSVLSKEYDPTFYNQVIHRTITVVTLNSAWQLISHVLESILLKKIGPSFVELIQMTPIKVVRVSQTARIKTYLSVLFVTLLFVILILKLVGS